MMTVLITTVAVCVAVGVFWASSTAHRLHRLHVRTESLLRSLQSALDMRVAVLAALDAKKYMILARETESISLSYQEFSLRSAQEKKIADVLRTFEGSLPAALIDADARVQLAHRFYNEAVTDTRNLRLRPLVRLLRLGGTAALPEYFELPV